MMYFTEPSAGPAPWATRSAGRGPGRCLESGWSLRLRTLWGPAREYSRNYKLGKIMMEIHRIDVNLKYETYCNAISDGGEEEWDFGWERYENSQE